MRATTVSDNSGYGPKFAIIPTMNRSWRSVPARNVQPGDAPASVFVIPGR